VPNDHVDAVALLAAALNDPERAIIGNPYNNVTAVSIRTDTVEEADKLAAALATIGCNPRTNILYSNGRRLECRVLIYTHEEQRGLLDHITERLSDERRGALETLVRARGPIPDHILKGIAIYTNRGEPAWQVAERLNARGVIDGMKCKRWNASKISAALREYDRRRQTVEEAA
jgi:hypothetical protein